jgi:hypothetical protein
MGTPAPFLDVSYEIPTGIADDALASMAPILGASPNPFRTSTSIRFVLSETGPVQLRVFDARGRRILVLRDQVMDAGSHAVGWDGRDERGRRMARGVYFAQLVAGGLRQSVRMVLADR